MGRNRIGIKHDHSGDIEQQSKIYARVLGFHDLRVMYEQEQIPTHENW